MNYFKNIDLFGYAVNFTHNSETKYRTKVGGIISLLFGLSYIAIFIFLAMDDFLKLNPQSYFQENPLSKDFSIPLNQNSFIGGIEVSSLAKKIQNQDRIFKPIFTFNNFIQDGEIRKIVTLPLKTITCDKIKLIEEIDTSIFNLTNYYCPDLTGLNKTLKGSFNSEILQYLRIEIRNCDLEGNNCESFEKVTKAFKDNTIVISVLYPEVIYDQNDYNQPLKKQLNSRFNYLNPKVYPMEEMYFGSYKVVDETTRSLIFSGNSYNRIGFERFKYVTQVRPTDFMGYDLPPAAELNKIPITYYGLSFILGSYEQFHKRKYKTLIDTLAQVNGLISIIYAVLSVIVEGISKYYFYYYLFKETIIYEKFEDGDEEDFNTLKTHASAQLLKKNSAYIKRIIHEANVNIKPIFPCQHARNNLQKKKGNYLDEEDEEINFQYKDLILNANKKIEEKKIDVDKLNKVKSTIEKKLSKLKTQSNSLNISYFNYCTNIRRKENTKIFNEFLKYNEEKFDFMTFLQMNYTVEILKNILMNPIQNDIINLFSQKQYSIININGKPNFKKKDKQKTDMNKIINYLAVEEDEEINSFDKNFYEKIFNIYG